MATTHEQESFTPTVVLLYISKENTNTTEHSCRIQNIEENLSSCQKTHMHPRNGMVLGTVSLVLDTRQHV